jgi:hypothetical protein
LGGYPPSLNRRIIRFREKKNTSIDKEESEFVIGDYTLYFLENVLNKKKSKKTFLLLIGMKNIYLKSKIKKGFYFS